MGRGLNNKIVGSNLLAKIKKAESQAKKIFNYDINIVENFVLPTHLPKGWEDYELVLIPPRTGDKKIIRSLSEKGIITFRFVCLSDDDLINKYSKKSKLFILESVSHTLSKTAIDLRKELRETKTVYKWKWATIGIYILGFLLMDKKYQINYHGVIFPEGLKNKEDAVFSVYNKGNFLSHLASSRTHSDSAGGLRMIEVYRKNK